jgi:hypothetical protein
MCWTIGENDAEPKEICGVCFNGITSRVTEFETL